MPVQRLRGERLQIMLASDELVLLDDFRFKKRMPSRAAAVRELFKRGLRAEGFLTADCGSKSSDFGVSDNKSGNSQNERGPV
ncbi:MAG TPA: hypothetical protein VLZ74_09555 [Methylocella sp.]|nr:hypothetical protein [Methylocella sp.]